jgi:diketogulonate reductase-like aldo/keto reductase
MYGVEVQHAVADAFEATVLPREELFLTTKIPCCPSVFDADAEVCRTYNGSTAEKIAADFEQLGVDYLDLLLLHWPCTTVAETVEVYTAMEPLVKSGRVRAIGVSNFNSSMVEAILAHATVKPSINQCHFSVGSHYNSTYGSDYDTVETCQKHGITYSAYSPLGEGKVLNDPGAAMSTHRILPLKLLVYLHAQNNKLHLHPTTFNTDVVRIAQAHDVSTAQVALRWVVQQGVVAVSASNKKTYDDEDLDLFSFELTEDEMALLKSK